MHYTTEDLKKHKDILRQLSIQEAMNITADYQPLCQWLDLKKILTQKALNQILHPEISDEDMRPFIEQLLNFITSMEKTSPLSASSFKSELGYLYAIWKMLDLDPLQHVPTATRKLVKLNTSVFCALTQLYVNGGSITGAEMTRLLCPTVHNRAVARGRTSSTFHLLRKHGLATRARCKGITFYTLTKRGKLLMDRHAT
jgi:hypothetical protein